MALFRNEQLRNLFYKNHVGNRTDNKVRIPDEDEEVPSRDIEDNLLLATWNIRDFDSNKFGHGPRLNEAHHYIAEIISRFDIVALQEINDDLRPLKRVMHLLGPSWDFITTDVTAERETTNEARLSTTLGKSASTMLPERSCF